MQQHPDWSHAHVFDSGNPAAERGTRIVMWITAVTMLAEVVAGWWFNSMALQADGWHMSSHVVAMGLSSFAYAAARRYAHDPRFAFGTWKIEVLAGFSSALVLLGVASLMLGGSVERLYSPQTIHYPQAMVVAVLGLLVNLGCAWILHGAGHQHQHHGHTEAHHGHEHHHEHHGHSHAPRAVDAGHHEDFNLKSAYVHVLADALTSVLAIVALAAGMTLGWAWLDPAMGLVGSGVVAVWAWGLLKETARALLDSEMDHPIADEVRTVLQTLRAAGAVRVVDLHIWRVGRAHYACILSLVTDDPALTAAEVKNRLRQHAELVHVTVEIHRALPAADSASAVAT